MSFFDYPQGSAAGAPAAFLESATDQEWALVRSHSDVLVFGPGEHVLRLGEADRSLSVLLTGTVEVRGLGGGRRRRAVTLSQGSVLGEIGFFDGSPRSSDVVAVTAAEVLRMQFDQFEALAAKDPRLGKLILMELGRALAQRLRTTSALLGTSW